MGTVVAREEIGALAARLKEQGHRIVLTNGCFDLLHVGHLRYLQAARDLGDLLFVGVNADESVRALKGSSRPYVPATDRAELVAGLIPVDYAFVFPELTADVLLLEIRPAVYAKGGDYRPESLPEAGVAAAVGARLVLLPLVPGRSTTSLLARAAGQQKDATGG